MYYILYTYMYFSQGIVMISVEYNNCIMWCLKC